MNWDKHDNIQEKVLVVGESNIFHFMHTHGDLPPPNTHEVCGGSTQAYSETSTVKYTIEEAIDKNMRPCADCIRMVNKLYNIEVYRCSVCSRLNLVTDMKYHNYIVNSANNSNKATLCSECVKGITEIGNNIE